MWSCCLLGFSRLAVGIRDGLDDMKGRAPRFSGFSNRKRELADPEKEIGTRNKEDTSARCSCTAFACKEVLLAAFVAFQEESPQSFGQRRISEPRRRPASHTSHRHSAALVEEIELAIATVSATASGSSTSTAPATAAAGAEAPVRARIVQSVAEAHHQPCQLLTG